MRWGLLISLLLCVNRAHAEDPDPWTGRDKTLHFAVSGTIAGLTYGASAPFFDKRWQPLLLASGVTIAVGAGKELLDLTGYGDPSWKDFTWDLIGMTAGIGLAWGIDLLVRGVSDKHPLVAPTGRGVVIRF